MIELKNISLTYSENTLYDNFNLKVEKGELILLSGPSGSGKSSLLRMIPGFIRPHSGEVILFGQALDKHSLKSVRQKISYISQDVDFREEIVQDLIEEIFQYKINRHISSPLPKIMQLMDEFQLSQDLIHKNIRELSGGERQRLGIIICLVLDRDIWLLDEVTSALDSELKEMVVSRIGKSGKTVLIVSHDPQWEYAITRKVSIGKRGL